MPSRAHQLIGGLIVRKMREKGYAVIAFDGNEKIISDISLKATPLIKRHKPDILGIDFNNKKICIGEAKTEDDLSNKRTKEQLYDYFSLVNNNDKNFELIIGIPRSAELQLLKLLKILGIKESKNISHIFMPDSLIYNELNEKEDNF